jgi:protein SCO1/2
MKEYLTNFKSVNAIGLTGSVADIDKVTALYGARYEITPMPDMPASHDMYTVAHTTAVYALDLDGRTRLVFPYTATVAEIAKGLHEILDSERAAAVPNHTDGGTTFASL